MQFVHGKATAVNCEAKEVTIKEDVNGEGHDRQIKYDYLIAATGLRRTFPTVPQALRRKHYLQEVGDHISGTEKASQGVVVIGGGE